MNTRGSKVRLTILWVAAMLLFVWITTANAITTNETLICPQSVIVDHFDGWGTSLCWWANVIGGYSNREEYVDLAFKDLRLNIVRYNIGGGENPAIRNTLEFRARMPGFELAPGKWDWNADANQRWVLRAAVARGVDQVVAFANSPPYWMTVSGSVTGSTNGSDNNLRIECEAPFANYLAMVVSNLTVLDGVIFNSVTPMNEPSAEWWKLGGRQEGAHMSAAQQARMIKLLRTALDQSGVHAGIVASEDNDERSTRESIGSYDSSTLNQITHVVTHTYHANDSVRLRELAQTVGKPLWVSEYGDGDRSGLTLARHIRDDIAGKHARAWIYWQFVDSAGWGLVANSLNGRSDVYRFTQKFHVMGQFSRFIRPGCQILDTSDGDSLVAYDPADRKLVIVAVNDHKDANSVTYNLEAFGAMGGHALTHQTLNGEAMAALQPLPIEQGRFIAILPAQSVTTFEIMNVKRGPSFADENEPKQN